MPYGVGGDGGHMDRDDDGGYIPGGYLTPDERQIVTSPRSLVLTLVFSVFAVESLVMIFLDMLPDYGVYRRLPPVVEMFLDGTILVVVISPLLYKRVFLPLMHLITEYRAQQEELREYQEELEDKVVERTRELDEAIEQLQEEIEERRQIEQALRDSEERIRQIMAHSDDAILLIEPRTHRIVDVNPTAEVLFGRSRAELLTMGADDLCGDECATQLVQSLAYARNPGDVCAIEQLYADFPGSRACVISLRGKCVELQGETVVYASFRDITSRVRLEDEARETQRQLIHVNRMTSLGMLVSSVAHEINNPNHYILMNGGLLQKSWPDILAVMKERYQQEGDYPVGSAPYTTAAQYLPEIVDGICDGAKQINSIVENLKNFIRDDRAGGEDTADITAVVRLCVAILAHHISRSTRFFTLDLTDELPRVRGNSRKLEQVVINLVMNALQSLPSPQRRVTVSTGHDVSGRVAVVVADEGCGIPPEVAARIYDPFFTTRPDSGGTGLGLSICTDIVRELGGCLDFTTVPGEGTVFTLHLEAATAENRSDGD